MKKNKTDLFIYFLRGLVSIDPQTEIGLRPRAWVPLL